MNKLGSEEWSFLDLITLLSFGIGLQNLDLNVTQEDAQKLEHQLNDNVQLLLNELHGHLEIQDEKLNKILKRLEDIENDHRGNL